MMIKIALAPLLLAIPSHCAPAEPPAPSAKPDCPSYFLTDELDDFPCDANPGDTIALILYTLPDALESCDDYGGRVIWVDPMSDSLICHDVDF